LIWHILAAQSYAQGQPIDIGQMISAHTDKRVQSIVNQSGVEFRQ